MNGERRHINFTDFKLPDGNIDWTAERAARRQNGEICTRCGRVILFSDSLGHPSECGACKNLSSSDEIRHERMIRCPACGKSWDPHDTESNEMFEYGDHQTCCPDCDHEFSVTTAVTYTFTSPPLDAAKPDEDLGSDEADDKAADKEGK